MGRMDGVGEQEVGERIGKVIWKLLRLLDKRLGLWRIRVVGDGWCGVREPWFERIRKIPESA